MVLDLLSFLAGVAAGAVTGLLAGVLHGLESTAGLQEKVRHLTRDVESVRNSLVQATSPDSQEKARSDANQLTEELNEIQEEIRRMYGKHEG
jgi:gas vesicle protein